MADDMKVFQPQVSKAVKRLVELGYLEVIGTHVPNKRGQTVRVLFDEKISTQDAIGIASSQTDEDLRPPAQKEKEVKELQDTWTEEEMRENKERLAKMLFKAFKTPADNPDLYTDKPTDSLTVKRIKRDIRDNMRKQRKELITSRLSEHKKNSLYNSEVITKEVIDNTEDMKDNLAVIESQKRLSLDDVIRVFKENLFNEIKSDDVRFVEMLCQIGVTEPELIAAMDANRSATPRQIVDAVVNARV
jgi:DNA-binding MarR family transcriptional regulator